MGQALKKVEIMNLQDILNVDLETTKSKYPEDMYFEIKKQGHLPFGFCSLNSLKEFVKQHPQSIDELIIRNSESTHWINLYEHPSFQRRKLQLLATDDFSLDDEQEYFILSNGQKHGPYESIQIRAMLESKEILITDEISVDGGSKWHKIYNLENFDRRALKESDELPSLPSSAVLNKVRTKLPENSTNNALSLMAFIKGDRSKVNQKEVDEMSAITKTSKSIPFAKILFLASAIGLSYFAYNVLSNLKSPFKATTSKIGEQIENSNEVPGNFNEDNFSSGLGEKIENKNIQQRQIHDGGRFEVRELSPIKMNRLPKKSFMDSKVYKDSQNDQGDYRYDAENDRDRQDIQENKYDDSTPIELDPVMQQVSKEVYDETNPENHHNIPEANREPISEEAL